jgi:hypothetical protein
LASAKSVFLTTNQCATPGRRVCNHLHRARRLDPRVEPEDDERSEAGETPRTDRKPRRPTVPPIRPSPRA